MISESGNSAARTIGRLRSRATGLRHRGREAADLASRPTGYSATAGLTFDADEFESHLVWIWGSPRTGSSWLLGQLCHPLKPDPRTAVGFEAPARGAGPIDVVPVDESFIPNHLAPALGDPREVDGSYVPGTLNNYLAAKPAYMLSDEYAEVWRPEARRLALVRLHGFLERAEREGFPLAPDPHMVIKEGNGSHASDLVMSLLPRARMIFLVRDGRDVVDSLLHAYAPGGFLARNQGQAFETPAERAEGLRWAARMWACNVDVTLEALAAHPPELRRTVRYEDLLADTAGEMRSLFEWLGLEREPAWLESMVAERSFASTRRRGPGERNRSATPGLWRENLSGEEQAAVAEIVGPRLAKLGYAD